MEHTVPVSPEARADSPEQDHERHDHTHEVLPDLAYKKTAIVNVVFYGEPGSPDGWVLLDTGVPGSAGAIEAAAKARFGENHPPAAILLTHGHVDHVGSLVHLAETWNVPIYAHLQELPYLDGRAAYPPPDPHVGGGVMPWLSPLFPRSPIDVSAWLRPLPEDGSVPEMPGWKWLHTPGHSPGHVSFWRERDRTVIAGDAFITTNQESAYAVLIQKEELHGPPMYFTQNWVQARTSVETLAALKPEVAVTGHGHALRGEPMRDALDNLARNFDQIAVPPQGKYTVYPTQAEDGSAYVPVPRS